MESIQTKIETDSAKSYKEREHRFSLLPISEIITIYTNELGLKNTDVQIALGYKKPNVIAMIKSGSMKFPPEKSTDLAALFKLDPAFVLRKALQESNATLYDTIQLTIGKNIVTENEHNLLTRMRERVNGFDVNFLANAEFVKLLDVFLNEAQSHQKAKKQASLDRIEREAEARRQAAFAK
jgi:hypothetical protein